jgi:hypothetical protein
MDLRHAIARSFGPPAHTWQDYLPQVVGVLVTAAVILLAMAVVANDVPWTLMLGILAAYLAYFTVLTAWRIHRDKRQPSTGPER